jgi:class 3 adenylate cyclase
MLAMAELPSGTVTFLSTDVEGSTHLWEEYPAATRPALAEHDRLLRAGIERHGGHVFKTMGDAFSAAFDNARGARGAGSWPPAGQLLLGSAPGPRSRGRLLPDPGSRSPVSAPA